MTIKPDLINQIKSLKKTREAIILAHNYQPEEIQDLADLTGDSLELSRRAASTRAKVIVFCGVRFMAETAAILNPEKIVLLPDLSAGCPMADMLNAEQAREIRKQYPEIPLVTYVNSTADVKAESTMCCTSANSVAVVNSFAEYPEVYMAPDQNLAKYTARHTNKNVYYWKGYCPIHHNLKPEEVQNAKNEHPEGIFLAHPECTPDVLDLADGIFSTSGMLRYARESSSQSFIIGTEMGLIYPLKKENPEKIFYPAHEKLICPDMKKITLEKVADSLENLSPRITIPEKIRGRAQKALGRMLRMKSL